MRCPRCRRENDILAYQRLEQPVEFEDDTTPVYKCPKRIGGCGFIFAPSERVVVESLRRVQPDDQGGS
jgi:hypothetical protein